MFSTIVAFCPNDMEARVTWCVEVRKGPVLINAGVKILLKIIIFLKKFLPPLRTFQLECMDDVAFHRFWSQ